MPAPRKLYRSGSDRVLGGVCGGLADFLSVDANIIRAVFVAATFLGGAGFPVYIAMWVLVPKHTAEQQPPLLAAREAGKEMRERAQWAAEQARRVYEGARSEPAEGRDRDGGPR